ncbi:MAG: methylmalonyl-CoA mutase subunit beta [Akkermansiaceae bacterium]
MEQLLSEFPAHSYEQWHAAAEALLKGAPFDKLLVSKTYEDITIQPIYRQQDIVHLEHRKQFPGSDSLVRGSHAEGFLQAGWEVSQELNATDPATFNRIAHEGLNGGQSELNIGGELAIQNLTDLKTAFNGINTAAISTYWHSGADSLPLAALFFADAGNSGIDLKNLRGCFDNDPFADLLTHGNTAQDLATRFDHIAALTAYAQQNTPGIRTSTIQGDIYHNAGATATQELGYVIATLVSYLEEMKTRGLSPESVLPHVRLRLAVGSDYFMEIAKIRATRWLWSKVAAAYGVENAPVHIHANTSKWNKTTYDAHTNMLRVTAEAFAAVVAGVDSLHIGPFDEISGHTDEFSRRIARNLHIILREECGLDHVIDPAGGSTYIEWLTDQIAAKSWGILQDIEKSGGMFACLENGSVQKAVEAVCHAKVQNIRRRKDKIVGSNMYPDLKGKKLEIKTAATCKSPAQPAAETLPAFEKSTLVEQAITAALAGATISQIAAACNPTASAITIPTLAPHRAAEEYEALRDASAAFTAKTGAAPAILQLNIGPSGRYRLRADWTASFFEAAGFAVDGVRDFATTDDAIAALTTSKATIAVITSDDATYQETVTPLAAAVKTAKPDVTLLVAGAPGDHEAAWRAAGVDDFVNVRSNNYELNAQLLKKAGVL